MLKFIRLFLYVTIIPKFSSGLRIANLNNLHNQNIDIANLNRINNPIVSNQINIDQLDNSYDLNLNNNLPNLDLHVNSFSNNFETTNLIASTKFDIDQKKIDFITNHICKDKESGINLIKLISKKLPDFDSIAPKVLHLNDQIIDFALNSNIFPTLIQKKIVLFSINFAIWGDEMGSQFLKFYYNLVHHCL